MHTEEQPLMVVESWGTNWNIPTFLEATDRHVCQSFVDATLRHSKPTVHEKYAGCQDLVRQVFDEQIGFPTQLLRNLNFDFVCRVTEISAHNKVPQYLADGALQRTLADEAMIARLRELREDYRATSDNIPSAAAWKAVRGLTGAAALFVLCGVTGVLSAVECAAIGVPLLAVLGAADHHFTKKKMQTHLDFSTTNRLHFLYNQTSPHVVRAWIENAANVTNIKDRPITVYGPTAKGYAFAENGKVEKETLRQMIDNAIHLENKQQTGRSPFKVLVKAAEAGDTTWLEFGITRAEPPPSSPDRRLGGKPPGGNHPLWDWVPKGGREQPAGAA